MKSNQKYKPLKTPSYLLYLAFMAAFALAALYFRQYLLAALYNAPLTISSYYDALVRHDLYGNGDRK